MSRPTKRQAKREKPRPVPGSSWRMTAYRDGPSDRARVELSSAGQPGAVFDEVVVDDWLHVEQMDTRVWWMRVGDYVLNVTIGRAGKPSVTVERDSEADACESRGDSAADAHGGRDG